MSADAPLSGLTLNPASAAVAFAAGVVSLLSPCVLALVPAYLGYLSASAAPEAAHSRPASLLGRALWFVAGFSVFFVTLGASATALG
ncbi:MAG TPA: cytochrome c biogenesis protein CcdA, partial [Limnochordales bacterium]